MKQKLILVALVVLLTVVSQDTFSLGLKEIQVDSGLNQPLKARVELMVREDEDVSELKVNLADAQSYKKVGLDKSFVPVGIQVAMDEDNPLQINVTSNAPITEPIVSLLLDVNWDNGKILREFTILLDPPVYNAAENVVINKIDTPQFVEQVVEQKVIDEPAESQVQQAEEVVVDLSEREPAANDDIEMAEIVDAQPAEEVIEEVEVITSADSYEGFGEIEVMSGDTLWSLAKNNKPSEVSTQQMVEALYSKNPSAFIDNNINRLIKGRRLSVPSLDEIQAVSQAEALDLMRSHNSTWQPAQNDSGYAALQTTEPTEQAEKTVEAEQDYGVELMGSDDQEENSGDSEEGGDGNQLNENAVAEELYNKSSENQELKERVSELENLVEQQQEALEIKSDDLANLQDQFGDEQTENTISEIENAEIDDVWGEEKDNQEPLVDVEGDESQSTAMTDPEVDQVVEENLIEGEAEVDEESQMAPVDADSQTAMADTDADAQEQVETQQPEQEPSMVDTAVNWVMDNLRWVLGGLVALIVLLFVPRFFRSKDNAEESGSFIDDIKSKKEEFEEEAEELAEDADTKLTAPLTEQVEELQQDVEQQVDEVSSELGEDLEAFNEKLDEGLDEIQEQEDEFDLDGFLSDEQQPEKEEPAQSDDEDEFEFDLSEFDDLEKESGLSDVEQAVEEKADEVETFAEELGDEFEIGSGEEDFSVVDEASDLDDNIADLEDELGLEGLHDLGSIDGLDDVDADQAEADLDISSLEDELDLETDNQPQEDEFERLKQDVADSLDLSDEGNDATEDTIMIDDDEDFDLGIDLDDMMEDKDAISVKFDLAKAYLEMGDSDGAKNLLKEVVAEGKPDLVEQAKKLLDDI